jgi:hypothetical protein
MVKTYIKPDFDMCWGDAGVPCEVPVEKAKRLVDRGKAEYCDAPVVVKTIKRKKKVEVKNADSKRSDNTL